MQVRHRILLNALAFAAAGTGAVASETVHHWSYSGATGPAHWASLEHDYAMCGKGKAQSPIAIETAHVRKQDLAPLVFDYKPAALHIINNGHSIQVNVPSGSILTIGEERYSLVQFHFHHPSEEQIDGKRSAMVAHLVHRDEQGHLAVVAVMLEPGSSNAMISTLWHNLPDTEGQESTPAEVTINPAELLPPVHDYFAFQGSLTTPPCSEGVRWFVLKAPVTLSAEELATFAKIYPANARNIQPLHRRVVLSSK
jgi:carbonic anhydrase